MAAPSPRTVPARMTVRDARPLVLLALAALAAPAVAQDAPTQADLEALYWERQRAAQERYSEADVAFMTGMIGHHAQALIMSELAPRNGASPAVQRLAARIINAQRDEIETMQRWLEDRGQPVPRVHIEGTVLTIHLDGGEGEHAGMDHGQMDHGGMDHGQAGHGGMAHDHASMPGMLTQAQLDELAAARGATFDRLFLTYMIGHHAGAVTMVDDLFGSDGAAQDGSTFKVASDIQVDQRTEIARMEQMLEALPDSAP